jgi:hypothetical protein
MIKPLTPRWHVCTVLTILQNSSLIKGVKRRMYSTPCFDRIAVMETTVKDGKADEVKGGSGDKIEQNNS